MFTPAHQALLKEISFSEREIDAIENKIANNDEFAKDPAEFSAMRREQEQNRQRILKCRETMTQE